MSKRNEADKLGSMSILPLLVKMSVPSMIGLVVLMLYNVVDTIFIGHYSGAMAIAGLAVVMPVNMLIPTFGLAVGVGGGSIISRALGENKLDKANRALGNVLFLSFFSALILTLLSYWTRDFLIELFGGKGEIYSYAAEYFDVVMLGAPFMGVMMGLNNVLRSEGKAQLSMMVMVVSSVFNIALDYYFMAILNMGIRGAGLATFVSQLLTAVFLVVYYAKTNGPLRINMRLVRFDMPMAKEISAIGISTLSRQGGSSVLALVLNNALLKYGGDSAVAVYGVLNRLILFIYTPIFGIVQGFIPVAGYNFGAKSFDRVMSSIRVSIGLTFLIGSLAFLAVFMFSKQMIGVFTNDQTILMIGRNALKIIVLFLPMVGVQIIAASYFQSIGKAKTALWLTMSRQIFILIPLIFLLSPIYGLNGVWYSFPLSDFLALLITFFFFVKEWGRLKQSKLEKEIDKEPALEEACN
ncbi:MATE family efflux transporter [Aureibacter tunicatorum]|uniref:Multidrug export protein MepA n=1 Tax=Aureibacter tunicatorum TaxID=866807 RepID=A0AAE4BTC3_9BACT|nr:MATE family efflux transporter [Aureibacter tunicatorum]MDR6242049.1 putative MATE family efflux protein [Aureibacter tunicatorum]BDD03624.1 MATE family efflux transporter [Aureibacter tunicatorum]